MTMFGIIVRKFTFRTQKPPHQVRQLSCVILGCSGDVLNRSRGGEKQFTGLGKKNLEKEALYSIYAKLFAAVCVSAP